MEEFTAMPPFVYVVTLNWNRTADTINFLESSVRLTYPCFRTLVVDNASDAGSIKEIYATFPEAEVIVNPSNLGFSNGMNVGIDHALREGADFVFIANNDTTLAPDLLDQLVETACSEGADVTSPAIYYMEPDDRIWSIGGWRSPVNYEILQAYHRLDISKTTQSFQVDFTTGCGMLLSRQCVEKVGFFDPRFFMYYEDSDYCLRAQRMGCKLWVVPKAKMWHRVAASICGINSPGERYYMGLSSVLFFRKHVRGWHWLVVLPYRFASAVKTVFTLISHDCGPSARAYLHGLYDGLRV